FPDLRVHRGRLSPNWRSRSMVTAAARAIRAFWGLRGVRSRRWFVAAARVLPGYRVRGGTWAGAEARKWSVGAVARLGAPFARPVGEAVRPLHGRPTTSGKEQRRCAAERSAALRSAMGATRRRSAPTALRGAGH